VTSRFPLVFVDDAGVGEALGCAAGLGAGVAGAAAAAVGTAEAVALALPAGVGTAASGVTVAVGT
jgi:hypothetical protein